MTDRAQNGRAAERLPPSNTSFEPLVEGLPAPGEPGVPSLGPGLAADALCAALEAIGLPAALLGPRGHVIVANGAFRSEQHAPDLAEAVRACAAGRPSERWEMTRVSAVGVGDHWLAIDRRPRAADPSARLTAFGDRHRLTPRQREVLLQLAGGASNKAIAATLSCAESTVELHVTALLARTGCQNRSALVARYWCEEPGSL